MTNPLWLSQGLICLLLALAIYLIVRKSNAPAAIIDLSAVDASIRALSPLFQSENRSGREELQNSIVHLTNGLDGRLAMFQKAQIDENVTSRKEASDGREQIQGILVQFSAAIDTRLGLGQRNQADESVALRKEANDGREAVRQILAQISDAIDARLMQSQKAQTDEIIALRKETSDSRENFARQLLAMMNSNDQRQDALRLALTDNLSQLRKENGDKLEQMRATVEEKLQSTLDKRLGDSFQIVSERLEQVHRGLGEMQTLAVGVGDLKKVLTNVKSRGGWGEVQLGMLIEDMLTPDQYDKNVHIPPGSPDSVEYGIRLPGKDIEIVYIPIDAKFPAEDYDRLLVAQSSGTGEDIEKAAAALERAIRQQAKTVGEKYIHPPHSTDFAILYLATEGLYAEAQRRPGLTVEIQNKYRVTIAGPSTLTALLNSLQMGFRTLAIEKRSSDVWRVLGAAKAEFEKYGAVVDKMKRQIETVSKTAEEIGKRSRAVTRTLKSVESAVVVDARIDSDNSEEDHLLIENFQE